MVDPHPDGLDGREHQQHSADPEEHQREAPPQVPVGRAAHPAQTGAGTSTAISGSVAKEEPDGDQGKTENLYGAAHFSSLQVGVARRLLPEDRGSAATGLVRGALQADIGGDLSFRPLADGFEWTPARAMGEARAGDASLVVRLHCVSI